MAGRTVTLRITGTSKELQSALAEAGLASDEASTAIGDKLSGAGDRAAGGISKLGGGIQNLTGIPVGPFFDNLSSKFSSLETSGQKFSGVMSSLGGVTMAAGVGGFAVAAGAALKLADSFETAESSLETSVKNSGNSWAAMQTPIKGAYSSMAKLGFNSTETAGALTTLTTATGSPKKAISDLGLAADLARYKHISLGEASQALAKMLGGSTKALNAMGINLDLGSGKAKTLESDTASLSNAQAAYKAVQDKVNDGQLKGAAADAALSKAHAAVSTASQNLQRDQNAIGNAFDVLTQKVHGNAEAYGKTLSGQMAIARAEVTNLGTTFGMWLIPKLTAVMTAVQGVIGWFGKHKTAAEALAAVIGTVLGGAMVTFALTKAVAFGKGLGNMAKGMAQLATTVLEKVGIINTANASMATEAEASSVKMGMTFAETEAAEAELATTSEATGLTMDAALGPIGLAIAAIGIAALLLKDHWKQIWGAIKEVVGDVVDFIKDHWKTILEVLLGLTGPIGIVIGLFLHFHDQIIGFFDDIWHHIDSVWSTVEQDTTGFVSRLVGFFTAIPGEIGGFFDTIWHKIDSVWSTVETDTSTLVTNIVGFYIGLPARVIDGLGDIGGKIGNAFLSAVSFVENNVVDPIINFFTGLPGNLLKGLAGIADDIAGGFKTAFNDVAKFWNDTVGKLSIHLPSWMGGFGFSMPHIPTLAAGGITTGPGLFIAGEAGPELLAGASVVPLGQGAQGAAPTSMTSLVPMIVAAVMSAQSGGGSGSVGTTGDFVVNVNGTELIRVLGPDIRSWFEKKGKGVGGLNGLLARGSTGRR